MADLLVDTLVAAGVERIYGLAGDSLNGITDSIRPRDNIKWIPRRTTGTAHKARLRPGRGYRAKRERHFSASGESPNFLVRPQNRESRQPSFPVQRSRENRAGRCRLAETALNREILSTCGRLVGRNSGDLCSNARFT